MATSGTDGDTGGADTADADSSPVVSGFDRTDRRTVDVDRWTALARTTLMGEAVLRGQLDMIFVDTDEMAEMNEAHMGHEGPTDVLSFPLDTEDDVLDMTGVSTDAMSGPMPLHLGDVVICPEVAERQAPEHCGTVDAELSLLVIHGVLHILGHDHAEPEETLVMQDRERHHLSALGIAHPVIA